MTFSKSLRSPMLGFFALMFSTLGAVAAQVSPPSTIHRSVPTQVRTSIDNGVLAPSTRMQNLQVLLMPSAAQQQALQQLLSDQRTPGTANYHKWLTPQQFGALFGVSAADEANVKSWLSSQGFTNIRTADARTMISFDGTAASASKAFKTEIHSLSLNDERHFSNVQDIIIPSKLSGVVKAVRGLDNFKPKSQAIKLNPKPAPQLSFSSGGSGTGYGIAPGDLATMYDIQSLYAAGIDGRGVTVAVMGQTDFDMNAINAYLTGFGLSTAPPQVVLAAGSADPGTPSPGDLLEASLDLEVVSAVARGSNIVYVNSTDVFTSLAYAIDQNLAQVITISYGSCELGLVQSGQMGWFQLLAQQANAQGITLLGPSGDTGAAACDVMQETSAINGQTVLFPAVLPEFTALGGTSTVYPYSSYFASTTGANGGSALSYIPEISWNDTATQNHLEATGGGVSTVLAKPGWQQGPGVPSDGYRDVPDVSFFSTDADYSLGYIVCAGEGCASGPPNGYTSGGLSGGTSASTPLMAGVVALLNNYLVAGGKLAAPGLGNINPQLYLMANNTTDVFHDITSGNNIVPCTLNTPDCTTGSFGYSAAPGYDQVTGWGSIDVYNLASEWSNNTITKTAITLTSSAATVNDGASITFTATVTQVSGSSIPSGVVNFYADSVLLGTSPIGAGGVATYTTTLTDGVHTIAVSYEGDVELGASTVQNVSQTVLMPTTTTITAGTTAAWPQNVPMGFSIQVLPASGGTAVTGTVNFYVGSTLLGTGTVTQGGGIFSTSALPVGADSVTAEFVGNSLFEPSTSLAVTVNINSASAVNTTTTLVPSATSVAAGTPVTLVATVTPTSGTTAPTGTVTFYDGGTQLGTASLSNGTASFTASSLSTGSNQLTANYAGSTNFNGSASAPVAVTVNSLTPVSTTTVLVSSVSKAAVGSTVSLTGTVTPASGSTNPSGTVSFYSGTTLLGSASLSGSTATLNTTTLPLGQDSLTAQYGGSAAFAASTSSAISVTILQPAFTMVASPSAVTVTAGAVANTNIVVTPENGFNQSLSFSCSGLPAGDSCSFGTPVQNADGTSSVSLNISTASSTAANIDVSQWTSAPLLALMPFVLLLPRKRTKSFLRAVGVTAAVFALVAVLGMTGCSGKSTFSPPAPSGPTGATSTITVKGAVQDGTSQTTAVVLTVN